MSRPHQLLLAVLVTMAAPVLPAQAWTAATAWVDGHSSRTRLVATNILGEDGRERILAGVHIELADGWKTYWRSPGDSGGIPPTFDWDVSRNIARAVIGYPAPHRFQDVMGTAVGYKDEVVFLIEITPKDLAKPVELSVGVFYGVCKDICIPAETELELTLPGTAASDLSVPALLQRYRELVPSPSRPDGPFLASAEKHGSELLITARYPGGLAGADLFVEAEDGSYMPVPEKLGEDGQSVRYRIDLSRTDDLSALSGKMLRLTIVSDTGSTETSWRMP